MLHRVPSRPQRATKGIPGVTLSVGYRQPTPTTPLPVGHDQGLFDPQYSVVSLQCGGGGTWPGRPGWKERTTVTATETSAATTIAVAAATPATTTTTTIAAAA